jgi:hypothetical protein
MLRARHYSFGWFSLAAGLALCCPALVLDGRAQANQPEPTRLTTASPQARLPLPPRPTASSVIVLRVSAIRNPTLISLSLDVALAPCPDSDKSWQPERLSSLGVYPPDHAGSYSLPVTAALRRLRGRGITDSAPMCIQVRLRRLHPGEAADALEVSLATPEWQDPK